MKMMRENVEAIVLGIIVFLLFCITSPFTVQTGDTGELVTNAYYLRVNHPPGYPLMTLLYHFPVKFLNFVSPFHSAALFTTVISLLGMAITYLTFKSRVSALILGILATSTLYWRYAVLPDVFMLHLFFLSLVFYAFIHPDWLEKPWFIFLISLSVAHHHTILFVFPLYLYALFHNYSKKVLLCSLLFGCLSFSLYFALILFHPNDYGSWGEIHHFSDVIRHFLREDYGTFSLASQAKGSGNILQFFGDNLVSDFWSVLLLIAYVLFNRQLSFKDQKFRFLILFLALSIYLGVFGIGGQFSLDADGEAVFERFLLQPILLFLFCSLIVTNHKNLKIPAWIHLILILNILLNVGRNFRVNNFSKNTLVEDTVVNIFNQAGPKSLVYTFGDSIGFAAYYVKSFRDPRPDIIHMHANSSFNWSQKKLLSKHPDILMSTGTGNILDRINFDQYQVETNYSVRVLPEFRKITYSGLIYKIEKSDEARPSKQFNCAVSQNYIFRESFEIEDFERFEASRLRFFDYGSCELTQALDQISQNDFLGAVRSLESGLKINPFSIRIQERLCFLYKKLESPKFNDCDQSLEFLLTHVHQQYYLFKH